MNRICFPLWAVSACFLALPVWGTEARCPFELLLPEASPERRQATNVGLNELTNDPREILNFIKEFGSQSRFSFPGSIDLRSPVRIAIPITPENIGKNNTGIFYFEREGKPRVMKILSPVPDQVRMAGIRDGSLKLGESDPDRIALLRTARELQGSALGEGEGAPVIQRFGTFEYKGKTYYAVEMDELFPGQKRVTVKEALRLDERPFDPFTKKHPTTGEPVIHQMADHFLKAILNGKNPNDADFMISEAGEVRWIDTAAWSASRWRDPDLAEHKRGGLGFSLSSFMEMFSRSAPKEARAFYENLNLRISQSSLTVEEKATLRDELYNPTHQQKYSKARAFYNYRGNFGF